MIEGIFPITLDLLSAFYSRFQLPYSCLEAAPSRELGLMFHIVNRIQLPLAAFGLPFGRWVI